MRGRRGGGGMGEKRGRNRYIARNSVQKKR